jgi:type IV pilus assembly protein PilO
LWQHLSIFPIFPNFKQIEGLRNKLAKIEKELEVAKKNARQLNAFRKKMQEAEEQFKIVMQALPENEEIPTLAYRDIQSGERLRIGIRII